MTRQIVKTSDDHEPILLDATMEDGVLTFTSETGGSWVKKDEVKDLYALRKRIEPWLTALFQSEHLNLLVGSGLSAAVQVSATGAPPKGMGWISDLQFCKDAIEKHTSLAAKKAGREQGNIEDQIRTINELIRGAEILSSTEDADLDETAPWTELYNNLKGELSRSLKLFADSIIEGESSIKNSPTGNKEDAFNYLVSFLMSFSSRSATKDRLHIFTTNYDRILEQGAELAGIRLIDRFVGTLSPLFRSSRLDIDYHYNPPGIRGEPRYLEGVARFTKLHGSLDWIEHQSHIRKLGIPFGPKSADSIFEEFAHDPNVHQQLMIYPNSSKDRETSEYPYVELFRDLAAACCRPNSTMVTYGYSFGDEHINRVLEDMLAIPSTHIVIIALTDPLGRIENFFKKSGKKAQISILVGDKVGDFKTLTDAFLPKPAIDRTTIKMADILRSRGLINRESDDHNPSNPEKLP